VGFACWLPHLWEYWLLGVDGRHAVAGLYPFRTAVREGGRYRMRIRDPLGTADAVALREWLFPYTAGGAESVPLMWVVADRLYRLSALWDGYIDLTRLHAGAAEGRRSGPRVKKRDQVYAHYDLVVPAGLYEPAWSIFKSRPPVVRR